MAFGARPREVSDDILGTHSDAAPTRPGPVFPRMSRGGGPCAARGSGDRDRAVSTKSRTVPGAGIHMNDRPSSIDYEGLLSCARGEMFGPGNPQLPAPPMLMFDRITEISADGGSNGLGHVVAELEVKPDLWFFACHFIGDPVMPGCLGLDALWQLTGFNLGWRGMLGRGRALGVGEVKFTGMVTPKVRLVEYTVDFTRIIDRKLKLGMANGTMKADGEVIYTATDMKVGLFQE